MMLITVISCRDRINENEFLLEMGVQMTLLHINTHIYSQLLPGTFCLHKYMLIGLLLRSDIADNIRLALAFDMLANIPALGTNHADKSMYRSSTSTSNIHRPCNVRRHYKILFPICIYREMVAFCVVHCISGNIHRAILSASIADTVILDMLF